MNIGPGSIIENSVIDRGSVVGGHFTASSSRNEVKVEDQNQLVEVGVIMGVGCSIESDVLAKPGTVIGNYSQVRTQRLLSGHLPDGSLVV